MGRKIITEPGGIDAARLCITRALNTRQMSLGELYDRLMQHRFDESVAAEAVAWAKDANLTDDKAYAEEIVRSYRKKGFGPRRIEQEFKKRRIPKKYWELALGWREDIRDGGVALELIRKRAGGEIPEFEERQKLFAFLVRRGFSWDEIRAAWAQFEENPNESE